MVIAVDGTSGSGKGTIASHLASELGYFYLDTGIYYRSVAYLTVLSNIDINDEESIIKIAKNMQIRFIEKNIILNNEDVTYKLRSNEVNEVVSQVSSIKGVRYEINDLIRNYSLNKNIVVDGRDISTVVFPNAEVKIYLDASVDVRARRRFEQNSSMHIESNFESILNNLKLRDEIDKNKEFGALKIAADAIVLDTTNLNLEESIEEALKIVRSKDL